MFTARMRIAAVLSLLFSCSLAFSGFKADAKAICVSGGEDHTLVLTANNWAWACGPNGDAIWETYRGVLGTGSTSYSLTEDSPVQVHGPNNVGKLGDITSIDAGWKHSLAIDVNGFVWSWGNNDEGELGVDDLMERTTPVKVFRGDQANDPCAPSDYLKDIVGISAGRSGEHSLAVDANGYAYGWGYNEYGQCGNDESKNNKLTPVHVRQGQQPNDPCDQSDRLKHVLDICAGADQSIALEKDDTRATPTSTDVYIHGGPTGGETKATSG